jgi:hypothetical protein
MESLMADFKNRPLQTLQQSNRHPLQAKWPKEYMCVFYGKWDLHFNEAKRAQNEPEAGISPVSKRIRGLKISKYRMTTLKCGS